MGQKCAYQYRVYPTKEQEQILARTFGCVRYVYNWLRHEVASVAVRAE
ncbi:MAG TPA: helix-turn-helix domain-containing protein [Ktedonobacteraceae bacterium]|nr:helix-turn-helix domain-containing protein [Ktedonobacteraceae bacterium]